MSKKLILLVVLFVTQTVLAGQAEIDRVVKLANTVRNTAITSDASDENLTLAEERLREVIDLLNDVNVPVNNEFSLCYDFAYQKYYTQLSSAAAADKATLACKGGVELEVVKFLYEKHYSVLSAVAAMDKAVATSSKKLAGKLDMIKFMYEKYYSQLSASAAATKASEGAARVKRNGGFGCLQKLYASYYQSLSAMAAMDKAVDSCSVL